MSSNTSNVDSLNLSKVKLSTAKKYINTCIMAGLVPFIQSSPGVGKSSIVKQLAHRNKLMLIDCRLSTMEPTDLTGLPWIQNGKATFNPYSFFPLEDTPIPDGYNGWLLFFDEFNSASRATQAAAYRVILDREIGMHKLHNRCAVVAAGNLSTDNAIVNRLGTAMASRLVHVNLEVSANDWIQNFAIPYGINEKIIAYINYSNDSLMQFDPDKECQTFPCPRTWEFVSKLLNHVEPTEENINLIGGAVSFEQAASFVQFCKVYKDLITVDDIVNNPNITIKNESRELTWAIITHLLSNVDNKSYKPVVDFVMKLPVTFQIVFFRTIIKQKPELRDNPATQTVIAKLGNYLYGD